jgi:solute carrier family 25 phosphate transporter 3
MMSLKKLFVLIILVHGVIFVDTIAAPIHQISSTIINRDRERDIRLKCFLTAGLAGAISCGLTHSAVVPIDVVKTRMQSDPLLAGKTMLEAIKIILRTEGKRYFLKGLGATMSGYFMQGFCKFGFYDLIKTQILSRMKDDSKRERMRLPILIVSSALAETIASYALCPMEMTRIFMVTNPTRCNSLFSAMRCLIGERGVQGMFSGLPFIMLRQIPYTCAKLVSYEVISENVKKQMRKFADVENGFVEVLIHLSCGIAAGVIAATISHPADVLLSKTCADELNGNSCFILDNPLDVFAAFRDMGWKNCFTGLQPRAMMIGTLTAMQFVIYEEIKEQISDIINKKPTVVVELAPAKGKKQMKNIVLISKIPS